MDAAWDDMMTVGRVVRPHGIRGLVIVAAETDFAEERFHAGAELRIRRQAASAGTEAAIETLRVVSSRPHDGRWIVALEGVGTMDEAEALRGVELKIPAAEAHELGPGAYYAHDLIGCRVVAVDGAPIGVVRHVDFGGGPPVLVVDSQTGEVLVPMAETICRTVDVKTRIIVIDPPEGLLDLNR